MNLAELNRRLDNLIRYGVIEETDFTSDPVQPRVRVRLGEDILTTWLPIAAPRANTDAEHDPVQEGEHVILLAPSGELAQAVVIGKLFSEDYPSPDTSPTNHRRVYRDDYQIDYETEDHLLTHTFFDEATVIYDAVAHEMSITLPNPDSQINITVNGQVSITALDGITITGDITHKGDYNQTGNYTVSGTASVKGNITSGGDVKTSLISLNQHAHSGVRSGDSVTGPPLWTAPQAKGLMNWSTFANLL